MDASETDLDVADTTKFDVGDIVEFQDDGEQCLVTALADSDTLTVIRGVNGTTAATHSSGVLVAKSPVWSYLQITDAIDESIRDLWPHIYKKVTYSVTPVAGQKWYELDDGGNTNVALGLSSVVQTYGSTGQEKIFYYGDRRGGAYPVLMRKNVPTAEWASGTALYLPYLRHSTNTVTVNAITKLTAAYSAPNYTELTDGVEVDCVMYYALSKMVRWTDIPRATQEDIGMSDESVRPMVRSALAGTFEEQAYMARRRWEEELKATLPIRRDLAGDGGI